MTTLRRILLTGAGALVLSASLLLAAGCKAKAAAKSQPQPFTGTLTALDGVQAVYTFRHPKLIADDLRKPTTDIPEAAMLQIFLGQLAPYGYPTFTEIAPGSNIGIVMLKVDPAAVKKAHEPDIVAFARIKEGGKIQTTLEQSGFVFQKHGDWTWIARDPAIFEKVKNADALTAFIDRPQTADLRAWGRVSPDLLARGKEFIVHKIQSKLANLPADKQKAVLGYFDVAWGYLAQLHSVGGSLSLGDQGIELTESAQFLPDSSVGTFLRYAPNTAYPKIAQAIPVGDSLFTAVVRQNRDGGSEFTAGVLDSLIAVDYPPATALLKEGKTNMLAFADNSDGGWVITGGLSSLGLDGQPPVFSSFGTATGHFTQEQVTAYYKSSFDLTQKSVNGMSALTSAITPADSFPEMHLQLADKALAIEGIDFGSIVTTSKVTAKGKTVTTKQTQYYGVAGGNLVFGSDEAQLRKNLPAVISGQPVSDALLAANAVVAPDEFARMDIHGGAIVDLALKSAKVDASDADTKDQIKSIKDGFAAAGPVSLKVSAAQAQATVAIFIPYKFVEQAIHLGQFVSSIKDSHEQPVENAAPAASTSATPEEAPAAAPADAAK